MSLETRIVELAQAVGADIKNLAIDRGVLSTLTTTAKNSLVAAINEIDAAGGDLTALTTTTKVSLVAAINELKTAVDAGAGTYTNATITPTTIGGIAAGTTFSAKTWQQMFDSLLYPYQTPTFSAFSFTGAVTPLEVGATIAADRTFTWTTTNGSNVGANTIQVQYPVGTTKASGLANDSTEIVTHAAIQRTTPGTETFRIIGTNSLAATFQRDLAIEWRWLKFSGNSALVGPLSAAQIQALGTSSLVTDDAATYTYTAVAGTYKYIACPTAFGTLTTFKDQSTNLDVPMEAAYVVSVTNTFGQTTNYNVYRTTNQLGAAINIIAS